MAVLPTPEAKPHILIVEDNYDHVELLTHFLARFPVRLSVATSGLQGWTLLRNEHIDLVILDYALPDLDGLTFLLRMRRHDEQQPVVLISSLDDRQLAEAARRSGVAALVHKSATSYFPQTVAEIVTRELGVLATGEVPAPVAEANRSRWAGESLPSL